MLPNFSSNSLQQQNDFWSKACTTFWQVLLAWPGYTWLINSEVIKFQCQAEYLSPFNKPEKHATLFRGQHLSIKATSSFGWPIHPTQLMTVHDTETTGLLLQGRVGCDPLCSSVSFTRSFYEWENSCFVRNSNVRSYGPQGLQSLQDHFLGMPVTIMLHLSSQWFMF